MEPWGKLKREFIYLFFEDLKSLLHVITPFFPSRVLLRKADSIIVDGGIFADNRIGQIEVHDAQNITVHFSA